LEDPLDHALPAARRGAGPQSLRPPALSGGRERHLRAHRARAAARRDGCGSAGSADPPAIGSGDGAQPGSDRGGAGGQGPRARGRQVAAGGRIERRADRPPGPAALRSVYAEERRAIAREEPRDRSEIEVFSGVGERLLDFVLHDRQAALGSSSPASRPTPGPRRRS
jgi:hypothetical protein